jgi:hypothetical protein
VLSLALVLLECSISSPLRPAEVKAKPALPPEPIVNHSPIDAQSGQGIEDGELILAVDQTKRKLNARAVPARRDDRRRALRSFKERSEVFNPGPGEYVHAIESQRHGLIVVKEGPYIVNIPPGVPFSFHNLDDEVAELVVICPSNVWEYGVLDYFPFSTPEAKAMAEGARRAKAQSQGK